VSGSVVIEKVDIRVFSTKCPICGKKIYGISESDVRAKLIDHMNEKHGNI